MLTVLCLCNKTAWSVSQLMHSETSLCAFAKRADPDLEALVRAAWSGSTLFDYEKLIT